MKKNRYKYIISLTLLLVLWNTSAWIIAKHFYVARVRSVVNEEKTLTQKRALDLADGFQRHLSFVSGIPDLLVHSDRIQRVVTRFAPSRIRSPLTIEARKKLWGADAELSAVSGYLQLARINLHVDQIYIVNAAGDCIASSIPFNSSESPTGSNFSERSIFASNREGQRAVQYAVGKTTHIPGLFFSTPIMIEGRFFGAVVVKIDVPNLAFITNLANAFVTDSHGVVILASKKTFEMRAMPDGAIAKLPVDKQIERYQASNFSTLNIEPWLFDKSYALMRLDSSNIPSVLMSKSVPEYGITVYVDTEFPHLNAMDRDNFWFASLLGLSGSILILMGYGAVQYVASNKAARAQLWQQAHFDLLTALPNRSLFGCGANSRCRSGKLDIWTS